HAKLNQPGGAGEVSFSLWPGARGSIQWSAEGKNASLAGTDFQISEWSAKNDAEGAAVYVRGATRMGGLTEVSWTKAAGSEEANLDVDASSVTIRQILAIWHLEEKSVAPLVIYRGSLTSVIHSTATYEVKDSDIDMAVPGRPVDWPLMHVDLTGT